MTIPKNTKKAKQILANAHAVLCYSLEGHFEAKPLSERPVVWDNGSIVEVTLPEFLARELKARHAKLTGSADGRYTLHVHGNLWYSFDTDSPNVTLGSSAVDVANIQEYGLTQKLSNSIRCF